jgi:hypothetical protein
MLNKSLPGRRSHRLMRDERDSQKIILIIVAIARRRGVLPVRAGWNIRDSASGEIRASGK